MKALAEGIAEHLANVGELFRLPCNETGRLLVGVIRQAASNPLSDGSIGEDCTVVTFERRPGREIAVSWGYHPKDANPPNQYGPSTVGRNFQTGESITRAEWQDSPSAKVPFEQWTLLRLEVVYNGLALCFRNRGTAPLTDLTFVIDDVTQDLHALSEGFFYVQGYVCRLDKLGANEERQFPFDAFRRMKDVRTLAKQEAKAKHLIAAARYPNGEFGRFDIPVGVLFDEFNEKLAE